MSNLRATGALELALVKREAQRLNQMQGGPGREAAPPHITGIPVNLGMNEDDVEGHSVVPHQNVEDGRGSMLYN
ncbi:MAG: hypothetical protein NTU67_12670 [Gemmatimonadetes bacterium]|nr:hypothetical protein [Gemmatimonadota bacterium]